MGWCLGLTMDQATWRRAGCGEEDVENWRRAGCGDLATGGVWQLVCSWSSPGAVVSVAACRRQRGGVLRHQAVPVVIKAA